MLLLLLPVWSEAAIYRWIDAQGKAHYSDKPLDQSSEYLLDEQTRKAIAEQIRLQDLAADAKDLLKAMQSGEPERVQPLLPLDQLNAPLDPKRSLHTPLTYAASENKPRLLSWLLSLKPVVDAPNLDNKTALFYAVRDNNGLLVFRLLAAGADPQQQVPGEMPLLHDAIERDHREALEQLLVGKAQVDWLNLRDETPLRLAVEKRQNHSIALLLGFGADPKRAALDGQTPYDRALSLGQVGVLKWMQDSLAGNRPQISLAEQPVKEPVKQPATSVRAQPPAAP